MDENKKKELQEKLRRGETVNYIDLPEGASIDVLNYTITIDPDDYYRWTRQIEMSSPMEAGRILGLLLGKAKPMQVISFPKEK